MMKKIALFVSALFLMQTVSVAAETVVFDFPNPGWHAVASPDGVEAKKCFVPQGSTGASYTEMLTIISRKMKNLDMPPIGFLQKQVGKDKNNYPDIVPEYVFSGADNAIVTWCSQTKNTCVIERAFRGKEGLILAIYTNKAPHYSQNMFGQWINNLGRMKVYNPEVMLKTDNLIEL